MGVLTHSLAGTGIILIGAWEVFLASHSILHPSSTKARKNSIFTSIRFILISLLSLSFIINSTISLTDALTHKDRVGVALQLELISMSSLFLLYSVFGLLTCFTHLVSFPDSLFNLMVLFAFGEEFLHFYVQRKDPNGAENRYFQLLLGPIFVCIFTTFLELSEYKSNLPKIGRGVGLIMQGTWFVQMGVSFFSSAIAHGCSLVQKSRGNYTVMCKGHMASHRGSAIATLQFNCHLALMVILCAGVYSTVAWKYGLGEEYLSYKPISEELRRLDGQNGFTLESDDENVREESVSEEVQVDVLP